MGHNKEKKNSAKMIQNTNINMKCSTQKTLLPLVAKVNVQISTNSLDRE